MHKVIKQNLIIAKLRNNLNTKEKWNDKVNIRNIKNYV
jgi:hypothetical protein